MEGYIRCCFLSVRRVRLRISWRRHGTDRRKILHEGTGSLPFWVNAPREPQNPKFWAEILAISRKRYVGALHAD